MSKGSVYFVNTQKLDRVYARVTVSRSAICHICYLPRSKLFLSICEELNLTVWFLDSSKDGRREKRLTTLYQVKLYRAVKHLAVVPRGPEGDRFVLSYESGEWDLFEVGADRRVCLVETDKAKEHEAPLTALDFHRGLNLVATSCSGGQVKLWSTANVRGLGDKQLLREINFPNRVDSVCFINEKGDLLVGHDRRLSLVKFITYWPFRDDKGVLDMRCDPEPRRVEPKKLEIRDQLFLSLKRRDEGDREAKKAKKVEEAAEDSSSDEETQDAKPPTPMTMRAQMFFDQLHTEYRTEIGSHRKGLSVDAAI